MKQSAHSCMILGLCVAATALSACTRGTNLNQGAVTVSPRPGAATPLTPAPLDPVQSNDLAPPTQPPVDTSTVPTPDTVAEPAPVSVNTQVASVEPAGAEPVTRQSMVGAWTVSTAGSNCQIFLALTKWSGGYRAASRGCSAPTIADVQAWDVRGKQVVLVNASGSTAATLYKAGAERYNGQTPSGSAISFSR